MAVKRGRSITNFGGFLNPFSVGGAVVSVAEAILVGEHTDRVTGLKANRVVGSGENRLKGIVRGKTKNQ